MAHSVMSSFLVSRRPPPVHDVMRDVKCWQEDCEGTSGLIGDAFQHAAAERRITELKHVLPLRSTAQVEAVAGKVTLTKSDVEQDRARRLHCARSP